MKLTDTIIDLNLNMMRDNTISKGAIYDLIFDIVFDLYEKAHKVRDISDEMKLGLIGTCKEIYDVKVNDYVEFIHKELTDEIKNDAEKLNTFMEEKVYGLIPVIKSYLIEHYNILNIH